MIKNNHIHSIGVFYHNDIPKGIGFILPINDHKLELAIKRGMKSYEDDWEKTSAKEREETVDLYFHQLEILSQSSEMSPGDELLSLYNIWFLEEHGYIKADNFNGCQFLYTAEE